jgi:hypothetical protein
MGGAQEMAQWILFLERICEALILGGGIVMGAGVRKVIQGVLMQKEQYGNETVATVETLSIKMWNQYNRLALISSVALMVLEGLKSLLNVQVDGIAAIFVALNVVILLRKLVVDRKLRARVDAAGEQAVGSAEQTSGHREVEILSMLLFLSTFVLLFRL